MTDPFVQDGPQLSNRWQTDKALRQAVTRLLPEEGAADEAARLLAGIGERARAELAPLADEAERVPPAHVPYDAWGHRVDRIEVSPAWRELVRLAQEMGAVSLAYERPFGAASRVVQAAALQLIGPASATALCPLSMTDGAASALLRLDHGLAASWVPRLIARTDGWTSGQWMTEKEGGSDVGRSGTVAIPAADGTWALHGTKWFTSATTADVALALARPQGAAAGSRGLSLFALRLRHDDGSWNGLRVRRLKDKLGTRALPTAELDLDAAIAVPVGGIGGGVKKVAAVLHAARMWVAQSGAADPGHLLALARDYAGRRQVAGGRLADQPVHQRWLAEISAVYRAMLQLSLRSAELIGGDDVDSGGAASPLARIVVPLAKMACARQGVWAASQLIETFGGAGYLEDTGLPRLLRDVQVQSIWEGTTTVMALDVLRALRDPAVSEALAEDIGFQLTRYGAAEVAAGADAAVRAVLPDLGKLIDQPDPADARRLAWGLARTYQAALLVAQARWSPADTRAATAAAMFTARPLLDAPPQPGLAEIAELAAQ
jgi:acyl-CoA dehydrogenase